MSVHPYIVVGGGIAGLLSAHVLKEKGIDFIGVERGEQLGGRTPVGHHRLYWNESTKWLEKFTGPVEWETVEDSAVERHKGSWREPGSNYSENEQFYLKAPFHYPRESFEPLVERLADSVKSYFQLRKTLSAIHPRTKKVHYQEGGETQYEKIIWCGPLELLAKVWKGDRQTIAGLFPKRFDSDNGGVNIDFDLELDQAAFDAMVPNKNTVAYSFRFKDKILRALGTATEPSNDSEGSQRHMQWLLFLPRSVMEDREEVAKAVRALKRELFKEFPQLQSGVKNERLVYLNQISGDKQIQTKSVEILPDVYYVGAQVACSEDTLNLRNLDQTFENCRLLEQLVGDSATAP